MMLLARVWMRKRFEEIEDAGWANEVFGAAWRRSSNPATQGVPLDGYSTQNQYGLFRSIFEDGFQKETADDGQRFGPMERSPEEDTASLAGPGRMR